MSRSVAAPLQAYMDGLVVTMCLAIKLGPLPDGTYRYFTTLDRTLAYDDGEGEQDYLARTGADISAFASSADLGVDNAEMDTLPEVSAFDLGLGITDAMLQAGELDKVEYIVYCLNYLDPSMGHFIWSSGTIGEQRIKGTGLINLEQRSVSNQLKQTLLTVDSVTCRAIFGSQPIGTGGGVVEEDEPCGFDLTGEWVAFTVTGVGVDDDDLIFETDDLLQEDNRFAPGLTEWLTGDNAGIEREVGAFTSDSSAGTVTLNYATPHPIKVGDTGRIRRECTKHKTGHNSCQGTFWLADWNLHMRAEPAIASGDGAQINIPGVGLPGGGIDGTGELAEP